jgi:23S rRNA (guanosine2251-2'-O)-methyltransferase
MKKSHPFEHEILIAGIHPVIEALRAGKVAATELVLSREDARVREVEELAAARGIPVTRSSRERMTELAGHLHHQGAVLKVSGFPYAEIGALLEKPLPDRDPLIVLDGIQDPQNLGAVLRSACFLGAGAVIIPQDRSARVSPAVIKVAAGAASYVPVVLVANIARTLQQLKSDGYWAAGLDARADRKLFEADFAVPLCLVVGNEQKGIRPMVKRECDLLVRIPAAGPLDSLNAASAAAVALYEVLRQRLLRPRDLR